MTISARGCAHLIFQFFCQEEGDYGGVLHCAVNELNLETGSLKETRGWVLEQLQPGWVPPKLSEFDSLLLFGSNRDVKRGDPHLALAIVDSLLAMRMTARKKACRLAEGMWNEVSGLVWDGREPALTARAQDLSHQTAYASVFEMPGFAQHPGRPEPSPSDGVFHITPFRVTINFYPLATDEKKH